MTCVKYGFLFLGVLSVFVRGAGKGAFSDTVLKELCEGADNLAAIFNQYAIASVNVQSIDQKEDNNSFYDTHIVPLIALASKQETESVITRNLINRFNQYLEKEETDALTDISEYFHTRIDRQPQFDIIKRAFNLFLSVDDLLENIVAEQRNIPSLPLPEIHIVGEEFQKVYPDQTLSHSNSSVRLYLCQYNCGYESVHKGHTTTHEKSCKLRSVEAFKYSCQYSCGYRYVQKGNVIRHEKICKLKPSNAPEVFKYPCQYHCGYKSVRKYSVAAHEQKCKLRPNDALEVFRYPCQYGCKYKSVREDSVAKHEMTCKLRPFDAPEVFKYPCPHNCGYVSVHKSSVVKHEQRCKLRPADAPEVFKHLCQYSCGYRSVWKNSVAKHEKICLRRPSDAPELFKHPCQYNCGYRSVLKDDVTKHEKRCKLKPSRSQIIGSKRKSDDDQTDPRKRQAL